MRFIDKNGSEVPQAAFSQKAREASEVNFALCYQCATCSLSCPVAFAMDYRPNQLVRMVQLGLKKRALSSSTIWLCANCETCSARCPNEVDILKLTDSLREMSLEEGLATEKAVTAFNQSFLESIRRWGKEFELPMLLRFKLMTRDLFGDMDLGIKMLFKGKLKLAPPNFRNSKAVKDIFRKSERHSG